MTPKTDKPEVLPWEDEVAIRICLELGNPTRIANMYAPWKAISVIIAAHAPKQDELDRDSRATLRKTWFEKGRVSALRSKNTSGCACVINEDEEIEQLCLLHSELIHAAEKEGSKKV
jgi:hypothetical protein